METIGLFPLKLVLMPGSFIPLHIFEERYKSLINTCVNDNEVFGINLNDSSKLFDIGCTAEVVNVINRYDDGRLDILVHGLNRYTLKKFSEGKKLYYEGDVEYFDDNPEALDRDLFLRCLSQFNDVVARLKEVGIDQLDPENISSLTPSFLIAQKSGLTLQQRQDLLEMTSENERLKVILKHLTEVLPLAREAEKVARIVKNDGYFKYPG